MRVCIVTIAGEMHGIGGMQRHTSDLSRGLVEAGHDVEVITNGHPDGISEQWHGGARWRFADSSGGQLGTSWLRGSYEAFRARTQSVPSMSFTASPPALSAWCGRGSTARFP